MKNIDNIACPFCTPADRVVIENNFAYALYDIYPVSDGHALIIPKRHTANYFELTKEEQTACISLLNEMKQLVDEKHLPHGYNVGININEVAGQTIPHVHIHLIPRYNEDVEDPVGGVRNVIPEKGNYVKNRRVWEE